MTSDQGRPPSDTEKHNVDLAPILDQLGHLGRYQAVQMTLCVLASALGIVPHMNYVFTGYQPDYRCNEVVKLDEYLPSDVTNFTLEDVQYHQCSIDVTAVSTPGLISTHSLPCMSGINFSAPSYTSFHTEWSLVCDKAGLTELTQTFVFAGEAVGFLVCSDLADRYGRKRVYILCTLGTLLAHITTALVPSYHLFLVGKITTGFFIIGMSHSAYTLLLELLPDQWRCVASSMDSVVATLASVYMAVVAYCLQSVSWRYLNVALDLVFVYAVALPWLLDESLRWLLATGNVDEAERILEKACRMNGKDFEKIRTMLQYQILKDNLDGWGETGSTDVAKEKREQEAERTGNDKNEHVGPEEKVSEGAPFADMVDGVCTEGRVAECDHRDPLLNSDAGRDGQEEDSSRSVELHNEAAPAKYNALDLFRHRVVFVPFLVVTLVWVTNGLYFNTIMLGSANLSGDRFLNFALLYLQGIPAVLVAMFFLGRFNRRPVAFISGFIAACFLLISVALATFGGKEGLNGILSTVAKYVGMFSLKGSFSAFFLYFMEVFPTTLRAVGSGAAGTMAKITDMAAPFLLLWGEKTPWAPGVLVGCMCCLASFSLWLLPETRHRKLPDTIEEMQAWEKKKNAL